MQTMGRKIRAVASKPYHWFLDQLWPVSPPDYAAIWRDEYRRWYIDVVEPGPPRVEIAGWAFPPPELRDHIGFTWNGRPFDRVLWPLERPDLAVYTPFDLTATRSGFHALTKLPAGEAPPQGPIAFDIVDRRTGAPLGGRYRRQFFDATPDPVVPTAERRVRVIADASEHSFRFGGYHTFRDFEQYLTETTGQTYRDFDRILDWGCGCGRVTRHFRALVPGCDIHGADVDPDNISYCVDALPFGEFRTIPLMPPTDYATGMFDMIVGVSIFTHLKEPVQFAWLDELRRITKPGGILLMTYHGPSSMLLRPPPKNVLRALSWRGFADGIYVGYDADIGDPDYYRTIWHTTNYIRKVWGRYFDVLAIHPCAQSHQDLVILRRR